MSAIVFYSLHLLGMAYESAQRAHAKAAGDGSVITSDTLTTVILAQCAAEGIVNDLVGITDKMLTMPVKASHGDPDKLGVVVYALETLEEEQCGVRSKYLFASKTLGRNTIVRGAEPFQSFNDLVDLRNAIIHAKPLATDADDRPSRIAATLARKKVARLQQQRGENDFTVDVWLNQIQTPGVAWWAADTASECMEALCNDFAATADFSEIITGHARQIVAIRKQAHATGGA